MTELSSGRAGTMLTVSLILALTCAGCSGVAPDSAAASPGIVATTDSTVIEVRRPEAFALVRVQRRDVADQLHLTGVVAPEVNLSVPVLSLGGGRVLDVRVRLGDVVKRGQVLVRIESPDLAAALADYRKLGADATLAREQLERADSLFAHGVIALKDLELARNTSDKVHVDLATAADRVRLLGGTLDQTSPVLEVRAPIAGTIVEQNVAGGTGVRSLDNSPNLFTVADLSRVWLLCDANENALARLHVGDLADIRVDAYPDADLHGRVQDIARVLDPATRSAKVRIELANPAGVLRAGMFVTATVRSRRSEERLVLPATALFRLHDRDWVFERLGANRFRKTEVMAGARVDDSLEEVLSGIRVNDTVVANALQFAGSSATP